MKPQIPTRRHLCELCYKETFFFKTCVTCEKLVCAECYTSQFSETPLCKYCNGKILALTKPGSNTACSKLAYRNIYFATCTPPHQLTLPLHTIRFCLGCGDPVCTQHDSNQLCTNCRNLKKCRISVRTVTVTS